MSSAVCTLAEMPSHQPTVTFAEPKLPYEDNSFDIITNAVSVDYLTKPIEVFKEMHRVLKPGGQAIMSFSNRCFPTKGLNILLCMLNPYMCGQRTVSDLAPEVKPVEVSSEMRRMSESGRQASLHTLQELLFTPRLRILLDPSCVSGLVKLDWEASALCWSVIKSAPVPSVYGSQSLQFSCRASMTWCYVCGQLLPSGHPRGIRIMSGLWAATIITQCRVAGRSQLPRTSRPARRWAGTLARQIPCMWCAQRRRDPSKPEQVCALCKAALLAS